MAEFFGAPRINVVEPGVLGLSGNELAGVRPEHVELLDRPEPGALEGTVALVELTGAESWVPVGVAGQSLTARAPAEFSTQPGGRAWVRVPPDRILRFPR